jgi:hypothetical protein
MLERHVVFTRVERPDASEEASGARARLAGKFPRNALRRMTHLGMLTGAALDGVAVDAEDAVVYATTYAETRALEDFLASFPAASPLLFQSSIHPSAVQQVLIGRQQPIRRFWPVTGRRRLVESALLAALMEPAPRVVFTGGEERGGWLLEREMAADLTFAFGIVLATDPVGATGSIRFQPGGDGPDEACPTLLELAEAVSGRAPLRWRGAGGEWSVEWR